MDSFLFNPVRRGGTKSNGVLGRIFWDKPRFPMFGPNRRSQYIYDADPAAPGLQTLGSLVQFCMRANRYGHFGAYIRSARASVVDNDGIT